MDRNIHARTTPWKGMKMSMPLALHKFKTEAGEPALQSQKHSPTFYFVCFQEVLVAMEANSKCKSYLPPKEYTI